MLKTKKQKKKRVGLFKKKKEQKKVVFIWQAGTRWPNKLHFLSNCSVSVTSMTHGCHKACLLKCVPVVDPQYALCDLYNSSPVMVLLFVRSFLPSTCWFHCALLLNLVTRYELHLAKPCFASLLQLRSCRQLSVHACRFQVLAYLEAIWSRNYMLHIIHLIDYKF